MSFQVRSAALHATATRGVRVMLILLNEAFLVVLLVTLALACVRLCLLADRRGFQLTLWGLLDLFHGGGIGGLTQVSLLTPIRSLLLSMDQDSTGCG